MYELSNSCTLRTQYHFLKYKIYHSNSKLHVNNFLCHIKSVQKKYKIKYRTHSSSYYTNIQQRNDTTTYFLKVFPLECCFKMHRLTARIIQGVVKNSCNLTELSHWLQNKAITLHRLHVASHYPINIINVKNFVSMDECMLITLSHENH